MDLGLVSNWVGFCGVSERMVVDKVWSWSDKDGFCFLGSSDKSGVGFGGDLDDLQRKNGGFLILVLGLVNGWWWCFRSSELGISKEVKKVEAMCDNGESGLTGLMDCKNPPRRCREMDRE